MNPWGGELLLRTKEKKVTIIAIVRDEQEKKNIAKDQKEKNLTISKDEQEKKYC